MNIKETRVIYPGRVRDFCIAHEYYTEGNDSQYEYLLYTLCNSRKNLTTNRLERIARDIFEHSNQDEFNSYDISKEDMILSLMFSLVRECCDIYFHN